MNFQVELTSVCDLTCGYCPNKDMERERKFMSDKVFDRILGSYILPFMHHNEFCPPTFIGHKDGEPLLNKKLPETLRKIPADMKIDIYSHGLMLPVWQKRGADFIDFLGTLPNKVRYMMSYHPFNHDDSINDYTATVAYLKAKLLDPPANIEFVTVSHKSRWVSEDMQEAWKATWTYLPITVHCNCAINPWTGRIESDLKFNGCPYGDFGHMFFGVTGNIIACCLDLEEEITFGNVMIDDPDAMYAKLEAFYQDQRNKKVDHEVCYNCHGLPPKLQGLEMRA